MDDEKSCDCGTCFYCKAILSGWCDYETDDHLCSACNGGGCMSCE